VTPTRDKKTTEKRSGPREGRPNAEVPARTNVRAIVNDGGDVTVEVSTLRAAADLIAGRGELDQRAYERGRLDGFADGWRCGLKAGAERGRAA
jgi:hypothetical protein